MPARVEFMEIDAIRGKLKRIGNCLVLRRYNAVDIGKQAGTALTIADTATRNLYIAHHHVDYLTHQIGIGPASMIVDPPMRINRGRAEREGKVINPNGAADFGMLHEFPGYATGRTRRYSTDRLRPLRSVLSIFLFDQIEPGAARHAAQVEPTEQSYVVESRIEGLCTSFRGVPHHRLFG